MQKPHFRPGEVLFLEREIPGIPYPTGYYVLVASTEGTATVSLLSSDAKGLYAIDNPYTVSAEDLPAFRATGERARLRK